MLIPFGYRKETDEYVDVDDVENGLACNCICPSCEMCLEARHGDEREHHFKHHIKAEKECDFSYWVAVRSMAKQILKLSTVLNVGVEQFFTNIPWKNQIIRLDIFAINPRRKNHGFDFELLTSIGYVYIYFVTPENESAGRYRAYIKNQPRYFTEVLILEIDLTTLSSVKKNAKRRLEKLIIEELDSKEWVTVSNSYVLKKKIETDNNRLIKNIISNDRKDEDDGISDYEKPYVVNKSLIGVFGLDETSLNRTSLRVVNTMIKFYHYHFERHRKNKSSRWFYVLEKGWNLYFINYEYEFFGVAKLDQFYIYQIIDEAPIFISKVENFEELRNEIDKYFCERDNIF